MDMLIAELLKAGIGLISLALTSLLSVLFAKILKNIKDDKIKNFFLTLETVSYDVVHGLEQTLVKELKAGAEDGKLTAEDYELIKETALDEVLNGIPNTYINAVKNQIPDLAAYIGQKIEQQVLQMKAVE